MGIENPVHLIFIAVVALIVLGPRRLPELARRLGDGVREFREAIDLGRDDEEEEHLPPALPRTPAEPAPAAGPASVAESQSQPAEALETAAQLQPQAGPEQAPEG